MEATQTAIDLPPVEAKPLPATIALTTEQWVSLNALKNEYDANQQRIDALIAEINKCKAIQTEDLKLQAEVVANVAKANELDVDAMNQYAFVGKELVKAGA